MTTLYTFTEKGMGYRTLTSEQKIEALNERMVALEKANRLMREALYATKSLMEEVKKAASTLTAVSAFEHFHVVDSALKASNAVHDMMDAQDAFNQSLSVGSNRAQKT